LDNLKQHIVKQIAQELDCGFDCYYNSKTDEIVAIPSFAQFSDEDDFKEAFSESLEKIEKHKTDFIKFETLESFESFKIMDLFAEQLFDQNLKSELKIVLANKKPYQNFKYKVDHSDFRQNWFDFKQKELEKRVKNDLERGKPAHNNGNRCTSL
jgi:ribosomal protein L11 methylase PrmA